MLARRSTFVRHGNEFHLIRSASSKQVDPSITTNLTILDAREDFVLEKRLVGVRIVVRCPPMPDTTYHPAPPLRIVYPLRPKPLALPVADRAVRQFEEAGHIVHAGGVVGFDGLEFARLVFAVDHEAAPLQAGFQF